MFNRKFLSFLLIFISILSSIYAQEDTNQIFHTVAKNGLEIIILENYDTPLVYIELAFKAGGNYQTTENEGLFHLYEHMLFKGNSLYKNSAQINDAMSKLGVSGYNGTTASDYVNYFFQIPATSFEKGIEFWASAVTSPLFDKEELEREKKVVISEILDDVTNTNLLIFKSIQKSFYHNAEQKIVSGNPEKINSATVEDLIKMQKEYYVPNNCAIFISGAVDKNFALETVEKYFGQWEPSKNKKSILQKQENVRPTIKDNYFLVKDSQYSANLLISYQGPNSINSIEDTYYADFLAKLLETPNNKFLRSIKSLKADNNENAVNQFQFEYLTTTQNGTINLYFNLNPQNKKLDETILKIINYVTLKEFPEISKNEKYFSEYQYKTTKEKLIDMKIIEDENPNSYISFLRFYWAVASMDVGLTYYEKLNEISNDDIKEFCNKYFLNKNFTVTVCLNESAFSEEAKNFQNQGFILLK